MSRFGVRNVDEATVNTVVSKNISGCNFSLQCVALLHVIRPHLNLDELETADGYPDDRAELSHLV
jgi:hypothetical protein